MATLKYKNGSTWAELPLGIGGTLDQQYPVGSFYFGSVSLIGYYRLNSITTNSNNVETRYFTFDNSKDISPGEKFGGIWIEFKPKDTSDGATTKIAGNFGFQLPDWGRQYLTRENYNTNLSNLGYKDFTTGQTLDFTLTKNVPSSSSEGYGGMPTSLPFSSLHWEATGTYTTSSGSGSGYSGFFFVQRIWQRIA